ncbi:MAG: hypothetical protein B6I25_06330 [Planctomycetales bacterium 4572_13]|nr:MAG: hypothetical protein B6I25_06330 [Planctomycetales bacterium 4572_13]
MPEAQARVETQRPVQGRRGGIPPATGVSDQREGGSGISRGRPNDGKRSPATAASGDGRQATGPAWVGWVGY